MSLPKFFFCLCLISIFVLTGEVNAKEKLKFIETTGRAVIDEENQIDISRRRALEDALYLAALHGGAKINGFSSVKTDTSIEENLVVQPSSRILDYTILAEQIHGLKVEGNTTVIDLMVQNDTFRGIVSGTIRGARTVRINPTGTDTYEVLLEIDKDTLSYLLRQARTVA
jgi:hypothetical protein